MLIFCRKCYVGDGIWNLLWNSYNRVLSSVRLLGRLEICFSQWVVNIFWDIYSIYLWTFTMADINKYILKIKQFLTQWTHLRIKAFNLSNFPDCGSSSTKIIDMRLKTLIIVKIVSSICMWMVIDSVLLIYSIADTRDQQQTMRSACFYENVLRQQTLPGMH